MTRKRKHRPERSSLARHLWHGTPLILVVSILNAGLEHVGAWRPLEMQALDIALDLVPPLEPSHVVVVGITDDDYAAYFGATSPLDPTMLRRIIEAIDAAGPLVIGVDIDTSDVRFAELASLVTQAPVVWARDADPLGDSELFELRPVLGGASPHGGVALMPLSSDDVVRQHQRVFQTPHGAADSFPWKVAKAVPGSIGSTHETVTLRTCDDCVPRYTVRDVLSVANQERWRESGVLAGKVVLLGGLYGAARDRYRASSGTLDGVVLMAHAVETELQGGYNAAHPVLQWLLEVLAGLLMTTIHHFVPRRGHVVSMLLVPPLAMGLSYVLFSSVAVWLSFVPVMAAVVIHELWDRGGDEPA